MKNKRKRHGCSTKKQTLLRRSRRRRVNEAYGMSFEALEDRALLAAITVGTPADLVDGNTSSIAELIASPGADGAISLREAIAAADSTGGLDTITFDATVFNGEAADVIRLQSELVVRGSVDIDGGDLGIVVSGDTLGNDITKSGTFITDVDSSVAAGVLSDNADRVFVIIGRSGATSTFSGLTITGGSADGTGGDGGGIKIESSNLSLSQSIVSGNRADDSAGGIQVGGSQLKIDQSTISDNVVQSPSLENALGGGISSSGGDVIITNSTVSGNVAGGETGRGGGVYAASGSLSISGSTISGNVASSPFGNSNALGGGVFANFQSLSISDSTITSNTAGFGGGIIVDHPSATATLDLTNSIVADNSSDIATGFTVSINANFSLIGDNSGTSLASTSGSPDSQGNLVGSSSAPIVSSLGALTDNGGLTQTHALLPGSPAIDAGNSSLVLDQRGLDRVIGSSADIGAFELQGAFIIVDTSEGFFDGDFSEGDLSLIEALEISEGTSAIETIVFDPSVFNGEAVDVIHLQRELFISRSVTIDGGDLDVVITGDRDFDDLLIEGTFITDAENNSNQFNNVRPFSISTGVSEAVTLRGLTVTGGYSFNGGGAIESRFASLIIDNSVIAGNFADGGGGGGVRVNDGSLTVEDSDISNNLSDAFSFEQGGGGVAAFNTSVSINNSTVSRNSSRSIGGGVFSDVGTVTIVDTEISDNIAQDFGGGISTFEGDVIVDRSTINGNEAPFNSGGGIVTGAGSVTVSNSTISGNTSQDGGGIKTFNGSVTVTDSTIAENQSDSGGAIAIEQFDSGFAIPTLTISNSIIANPNSQVDIQTFSQFGDIQTVVTSSLISNNDRTNLDPAPVGSPDANGNFIGEFFAPIDPVLGPLADNGGPTQTHALLAGSPAIDTGDTTSTTDQRGEPRPNAGGNGPDMGAFEEQSLTLVVDTSNDLLDGDFSAGNQSLREAIQRANANEGIDRIIFDANVFDGMPEDVIRLVNGELLITEGLAINTGDLQIVVSGDSLGNDVFDSTTFIVDVPASDSANTLGDNSRVFNIATSAGESVSLGGLTITGGNAAAGGGGIAISSAVVELANVVVAGNRSSGDGGGILTDSELTLNDSFVSGNIASSDGVGGDGGGIAVLGTEALRLNNSTVSENSAATLGGGIFALQSAVTVDGSSVVDNSSADKGGGIATETSAISLTNSNVSGNQSVSNGGGIFLEQGSLVAFQSTIDGNSTTGSSGKGGGVAGGLVASISLEEVTLSANQSVSDGGGIYSEDGSVSFTRSTISGNGTTGSDAGGGGIFALSSSVEANSSTVSGNTSTGDGGGLFVQGEEVLIVSSTISGNSAIGDGGGLYTVAADISIFSSTVALNESVNAFGGGGLHNVGVSTFDVRNSILASNIAAGDASDLRLTSTQSFDVEFSLIGTNNTTKLDPAPVGSPDANGNLVGTSSAVIDPLLDVLSLNGGLTQTHALLANSPAIDAGSSTLNNDQRGRPFVRDAGNAVDIGAFESQRLELIVDTERDEVDGDFTDNQLSLREAIQLANANPGEDLINFDPNEFRGSAFLDTIHLGLGELMVTESLQIDGGDLGIVISGDANRDDVNSTGAITDIDRNTESRLDDNSGVFNITAPAGDLVTLSGLTITGGVSSQLGGITNGAADLVISESIIAGNQSSVDGGGVSNESGSITIDRTTISGNRTVSRSDNGGGIYSDDGDVSISFSTISDNQTLGVQSGGGGIYIVDGTLSLTLSTVSGNQALGDNSNGGGISSLRGDIILDNVTLTQNVATGVGGGISVLNRLSNSALTLNNTIVAGNEATDRADLAIDSNVLVDVQFSLIGDNTGTSLNAAPVGSPDVDGNLIGTAGSVIDPLLGALLDNRGPTLTHDLLPGSPAIDAGFSSFAVDQRDDPAFARNDGGGVDIGSFERFAFTFVVDTSSDIDDGDLSAGNLSLREALALSNDNPSTDTITFDPTVFNGEPADVIRLLETLFISEGVIIDAAGLGIVISGDVDGNDVLVAESNVTDTFASETNDTLDDNVRVIDITAAAGEVITIDGLTVTGGQNSGDGAGIRTQNSDLELTNALVAGNRTTSFGQGGGIHSEDGNVTLNETVVSDNLSNGNGGGVYSDEGTIVLNDSSIKNNVTGTADRGGGIYSRLGDVLLNESSVSNNTTGSSGDGGGIYTSAGDVTLNDSSVNDNVTGSDGEGGGIYTSTGRVSLTGSSVSNNTTGTSAEGGGIYTSSGDVSLIDSTVDNNTTTSTSGRGGGIFTNNGAVTLSGSSVSHNVTEGSSGTGGGIYAFNGDVSLTSSSVSNNTTGFNADGGGIYTSSGDVSLIDSTISNNVVGGSADGGGIHSSDGNVTAIRSSISLNQSGGDGGGIETFSGDVVLLNSTISGNQTSGQGGGINAVSSDLIQIVNSTIVNNQSGNNGGGVHGTTSSSDDLIIENSIIAGNITTGGIGPDLEYGSSVDSVVRFSLIGDSSGTPLAATGPSTPDANGNLVGSPGDLVDPLLAALADNGGPTLTHALLADSPAINAGGSASIAVGPIDQRGSFRVVDGQIDIGAVESETLGVTVANVIVSGSGYHADFIDAIDGDGIGSGNGLGFSLVGDHQLTSVPWTNVDTLYLEFSADVSASLADGDILLTGH